MKKFVLSLFAVATATFAFAQDASQPQGSWYLGTGDATTLLNVFSSGVAIDAPWVTQWLTTSSSQVSANGPTFDALNLSIGAAYFMGDYWVGLHVDDVTTTSTLDLRRVVTSTSRTALHRRPM